MSNTFTDNQLAILDLVKTGDSNSLCGQLVKLKDEDNYEAFITNFILYACQFDRIDILKILTNNYSLDVSNEESETPLFIAVKYSSVNTLKFLLSGKHYSFNSGNGIKEKLLTLALQNADYQVLECLQNESLLSQKDLTGYLEKIVSLSVAKDYENNIAKPYDEVIHILKLLGAQCTEHAFKIAKNCQLTLSYLYPSYLNALTNLLEQHGDIIHNILSRHINVPLEFLHINPKGGDKISLLTWLQNELKTITTYYDKIYTYPIINKIREMLQGTNVKREINEQYYMLRKVKKSDTDMRDNCINLTSCLWRIHQVMQYKILHKQSLYSNALLEICVTEKLRYLYEAHLKLGTEELYISERIKPIEKPKMIPPFFDPQKNKKRKESSGKSTVSIVKQKPIPVVIIDDDSNPSENVAKVTQ